MTFPMSSYEKFNCKSLFEVKQNYTGYVAHNDHYGDILIGNCVGNNHYEFFVPPVSSFDADYHTNIYRYPAKDLIPRGFLDLNLDDEGDFIDSVQIDKYIGLDYKPDSKLYIGSPTGKKVAKVYKNNWSTMETRHMMRVKQKDAMFHGFGFDNGGYADFVNGQSFDEEDFLSKLRQLVKDRKYPDILVVPDIISGGLDSLKFSIDFMPKLDEFDFPKYLVVQNGMTPEDVEPYLDKNNNDKQICFDALFVGGTPVFKGFGKKQTKEVEWKLKTMESWVKLAHKYGKKCHIGRVSSIRRLNFSRSIGADSSDTSIVNFSPKSFKMYENASKQSIMSF